jgi:hypothetical protein
MNQARQTGWWLFGMGSLLNFVAFLGFVMNQQLLSDGVLCDLLSSPDALVVKYGEDLLRFLFILVLVAALLILAAIFCWIGGAIQAKTKAREGQMPL